MSGTSREERIGLNEAVFRDVNERIQDVAAGFDVRSEPLDLICECGDAKCVKRIILTREAYEQIRSDAHLFARCSGTCRAECRGGRREPPGL